MGPRRVTERPNRVQPFATLSRTPARGVAGQRDLPRPFSFLGSGNAFGMGGRGSRRAISRRVGQARAASAGPPRLPLCALSHPTRISHNGPMDPPDPAHTTRIALLFEGG